MSMQPMERSRIGSMNTTNKEQEQGGKREAEHKLEKKGLSGSTNHY